jgi:carboxylesterase
VLPTAQPLSVAARPELTGGRRIGVLLSHGFTGSPGSMRAWGEHLAEKGYAVEVPRLPGHGTSWRDMNTTTWADWYGELGRVLDRLTAENDDVVVGGLSMGGALVLRLAADNPDRIAGVVVVNPAVASKRWDVKLLPVLKHLLGAMPGIGSDIKKDGVEELAYAKIPLKAVASLQGMWPAVGRDLAKITCPVLVFRSRVDHVVPPVSGETLLRGLAGGTVEERVLEDSYHVATLDNDAPMIFARSVEWIRERVPAAAPESA